MGRRPGPQKVARPIHRGPCGVGVGVDHSGPAPVVHKCGEPGVLHWLLPPFQEYVCPKHCAALAVSERHKVRWDETHCLKEIMAHFIVGLSLPTCGAESPGGRMHCEYPPDHMVAGYKATRHLGRDRLGRWRSWPVEEVKDDE